MRHPATCALVASAALTLGALGLSPTPANSPTQRLVPVSLAEIQAEEDYAADVANIIGAAYAAAVAPTEIRGAEPLTGVVPLGASGVEVADTLAGELPLNTEAQDSVATLVDTLSADTHPPEEDPVAASIDDGAQTVSVTVTPAEITAARNLDTGELVLEVSTLVASLDENGIETIELIEAVLIANPHTGAIRSLELLDTEDYSAATQHDSPTKPH